jgi:alpha-N-arabinofuranosidase
MQPIMAVWAGMKNMGSDSKSSLNSLPGAGYSLGGTSVAENQLVPYIQQAVDQVSFRTLVIPYSDIDAH